MLEVGKTERKSDGMEAFKDERELLELGVVLQRRKTRLLALGRKD